jgi:hypothetical protein
VFLVFKIRHCTAVNDFLHDKQSVMESPLPLNMLSALWEELFLFFTTIDEQVFFYFSLPSPYFVIRKKLIDIKPIGSFPIIRASTLLLLLTNNEVICFEFRFLLCTSKHWCNSCGNYSICFLIHQLLSSTCNNECVDMK